MGRIIWLLKRPRVQILQKTLESSKLTLSCMLTTLLFGETLANRRYDSLHFEDGCFTNTTSSSSTEETGQDEARQQAVSRSSIIASQITLNELKKLENAEALHDPEQEISMNSTGADPRPGVRSAVNQHSRIMGGELMPLPPVLETKQLRRNSVLLDMVLSGASMEGSTSSYVIS